GRFLREREHVRGGGWDRVHCESGYLWRRSLRGYLRIRCEWRNGHVLRLPSADERYLLTLSINNNLTSNPLTGVVPTQGVIKVISSSEGASSPKCDPRFANPTPTLRGDSEIPEKHPSGPSSGS